MKVDWLDLRDFRCHPELSFTPEDGVNVLLGPNGAGKTSVLEALAYASVLRSFRRTPDPALVREGASEAIVRVGVASPAGERKIEIALPHAGRRRVLVNGKRPRSNADLADSLFVVAFLPDDLDLVKGSPSRRRDLVDELSGQLWPEASAAQAEFARALRQRNALLKQEGRSTDPASLSVWDERLADAGGKVTEQRLRLVQRLVPVIAEAYASVAGESTVTISYSSKWVLEHHRPEAGHLAAALLEALLERRRRDMDVRATTAGPHRDEPVMWLDGRRARTQASQGEQRSVALALRLASYRLLEERNGRPPVLLLDDVFSELDVARADGVMEILPRGQVFVTSAREDEVPVVGRRWLVSPGRVT